MFTEVARRVATSSLAQALVAPHVDRYLQLLRATFSTREVLAEVTGVHRRATSSLTLRLRPNASWQGFRAGQFINVTVDIDGVGHTRCYSLANSEHNRSGEIELTVRAHAHGRVSRHLHINAARGTLLRLSQAGGDFVLPMPRPRRLVLISGGSGITPVIAMLRTLADEGHEGTVSFLHFAPHAHERPYQRALEEIVLGRPNFRVETIITHPERAAQTAASNSQSRRGGSRHLTRSRLRHLDRAYGDAEVYVCGPPQLIAAARAIWAHDGAAERVHSESFRAAIAGSPCHVGQLSGRA